MLPYLTVLLTVTFVTYLARCYGSKGVRILALIFSGLVLIVFAGFRDYSIGTDTYNYIGFLREITSFQDVFDFRLELGFNFLVFISGWASEGYLIFLTLIAIVVVSCYMITIFRLSNNFDVAVFLFISLGSYTFFFNGARQGLAAAICFFALRPLLERRAISYFFIVSIAVLFHKSAIVAFPLYFLARPKVGARELLVLGIGLLAALSLGAVIGHFAVNFIDEKYASYTEAGEGGGRIKLAFLVLQGILFKLLERQVFQELRESYARLVNVYLIGLVPAGVSVLSGLNPSGVLRLTVYFEHSAILLWPMILLGFQSSKRKLIFTLSFMSLVALYFVLTTSSFSNLVPYRINSELFY